MGTYVYRVTKETVACSDGEKANIAIYAFKPFWDAKRDAKLNFQTGCVASDRMAAAGRLTKRIILGRKNETTGKIEVYENSEVFLNVQNMGSFYDSTLGMKNQLPRVHAVTSVAA